MALVVAAINQIALTQRLEEFGLLHAIGQAKSRLVRRVTLETTVLAGIGWIVGLALAGLILVWLKSSVYEPGGLEMNLASVTPLWFTLLTPLAVIALGAWSVGRVLARLDAIAVIERGQLGMEADQSPKGDVPRRTTQHSRMSRSPANPLSSLTFYLRHRRRGLMLVAIMALMVLGVALPVFVLSPISQAQKPIYEHLSRWSVVMSVGNFALDPGMVAQIKTFPAVAQAIPTIRTWLSLSVPPFSKTGMWVYSVPEDSLPYLVDLCQVRLKEGRLPRPRTNEVVVSEAVAQNRGLGLGSKVGQPVNIQDGFPTEMVVVGILSPSNQWLGFASYEYQQSNALYGSPAGALLVLPAEGRKAELDDWLEKNMVTARTEVLTFAVKFRQLRQSEQGSLALFAAFESIIAIVAAFALAVLNTIFFSQRQDEFGILHAVGHSHLWLVLRAVKETASVIAVAWLIGAAVCLALMVYAQANVFAPAGVKMDLFNLGPWLFTLPIPLTVLAASTGTIARMLSKLDPVSIIERR
jgi:ABC-type lipoprotein release transport system permease subunit